MVLARYSLVRPHPEPYKSVEGSRLALIAAGVALLCATAVFLAMVLRGHPLSIPIPETPQNKAALLPIVPARPITAKSAPSSTAAPAKQLQQEHRLVFSLTPSRHFQHLGTVGVEVRRIDAKHGNYDVTLLVNRHRTTKRRVKLNESIALKSTKDGVISALVVNEIQQDRVSGYITEAMN